MCSGRKFEVDEHRRTRVDIEYREIFSFKRERNRFGKHRYGVALSPHNGRDSLVDAYQEALDKVVYLKNALVELEDVQQALDSGWSAGSVVGDVTKLDAVREEYGEAVLAAHRLRSLVGTQDRLGGSADEGP